MPSSKVNATAVIETFSDAEHAFNIASLGAQRNNSIKICNNTYLIREMDGDAIVSYALAFHGSKIIRYHADGSFTLDSHGYRTATTKHRFNQFTPFSVSQRAGEWYLSKRNPSFKMLPMDAVLRGEVETESYWRAAVSFVDGMHERAA